MSEPKTWAEVRLEAAKVAGTFLGILFVVVFVAAAVGVAWRVFSLAAGL